MIRTYYSLFIREKGCAWLFPSATVLYVRPVVPSIRPYACVIRFARFVDVPNKYSHMAHQHKRGGTDRTLLSSSSFSSDKVSPAVHPSIGKKRTMMTGPVWMALAWVARPAYGFLTTSTRTTTRGGSGCGAWARRTTTTLAASASTAVCLDHCLSRLSVLQTLLSHHGAPGSIDCQAGHGDLQPIPFGDTTPELVTSLTGPDPKFQNLHPYLVPIAQSTDKPESLICAYRNPFVEESSKSHPWPIVEARVNGPGMRFLALNSEHLMRRMACEADYAASSDDGEEGEKTLIIDLYNQGLGQGTVPDAALDVPYQAGSVQQLGYGVDKYVLLRVGPFADLYQRMAEQHAARGDEQSSLISAEAANGKCAGFGSNFLFYARLLNKFPNRQEEARDAARMCLRLPLSTIGLEWEDFRAVAVMSQAADASDSLATALPKLAALYDKMRAAEVEENTGSADGKTLEQMAIDEANGMLDRAVLTGQPWGQVRPAVAEKFRSVGRDDFARFVDLQT